MDKCTHSNGNLDMQCAHTNYYSKVIDQHMDTMHTHGLWRVTATVYKVLSSWHLCCCPQATKSIKQMMAKQDKKWALPASLHSLAFSALFHCT